MAITPDLKLVVPARRDENGRVLINAYHTPISREVFEANYRILSATKAALFSKGLAFAADTAPQIAALRLRDEGRRDAAEQGLFDHDGGVGSLLAEIRRLTLIPTPGPNGWTMLPVDHAINAHHIDAEDWHDAESAIVFFTCAYWMAQRAVRQKMATAIAGVMGASITSSEASEYCASLAKSTEGAGSTKKAVSSVPS